MTKEVNTIHHKEKKEIKYSTDSNEKEEIVFRPREDPMEDPFRPLQKNCDNSVPWPDERSGWAPSQVTADLPNTINHWGDPGSPTL